MRDKRSNSGILSRGGSSSQKGGTARSRGGISQTSLSSYGIKPNSSVILQQIFAEAHSARVHQTSKKSPITSNGSTLTKQMQQPLKKKPLNSNNNSLTRNKLQIHAQTFQTLQLLKEQQSLKKSLVAKHTVQRKRRNAHHQKSHSVCAATQTEENMNYLFSPSQMVAVDDVSSTLSPQGCITIDNTYAGL